MQFVWLSTTTALLVCHSLSNACHLGSAGDKIFQQDREVNAPAGKPSHVIVMSRNGRKRAARITP